MTNKERFLHGDPFSIVDRGFGVYLYSKPFILRKVMKQGGDHYEGAAIIHDTYFECVVNIMAQSISDGIGYDQLDFENLSY